MLDIPLISQGFLGLPRATSVGHRSVQLPMVCRAISNETTTSHQPRSQRGVEGGQREEGGEPIKGAENVCLSSLKPARTGTPLP